MNKLPRHISRYAILESIYGKFIVNRFDKYCAKDLLVTGKTHIEAELKVIFSIINKFSDNCVVIDGGANFGFFSIPVSEKIKDKNGIVLAFEPQYDIFSALSGSIILNNIDNIILNRIGLADTYRTAVLPKIDYDESKDFGTIYLESLPVTSIIESLFRNFEPIVSKNKVEVIPIDSLNLYRLDFLKLDIEGCEILALQGAKNTIVNYRPYIWLEYHIVGLNNIKRELSYLENYEITIIDPQNVVFSPKEKMV